MQSDGGIKVERPAAAESVMPDLEAEVEQLLSLRARDMQLSSGMRRAYWQKTWRQRGKIARDWMVWVGSIAIAFVPVSYLMAPGSVRLTAGISGLLVPVLHACGYLVWRRPRSTAVEGLSVIFLMSSVMIAYGLLAVAAGGRDYERFMTCVFYVNTIAIVVFQVETVWSLALMISSTAIFLGFQLFNPAIDTKEAIGTSVFYAMAIYAVTMVRKAQLLLSQKHFLMSLRDQYRSGQLEWLANCDPLTGLLNRRSADDLIAKIWSNRRIAKASIAFIMADIDSFKRLNDTAGHAAGDECIRVVARTIEASVRRGDDLVVRHGGEEFLIVLTKVTPDVAWMLAERIRCAIEAHGIVNPGLTNPAGQPDGAGGVVTISLGVAFARDDASPALVTKWADDALYDAKRNGRNRVFLSTAAAGESKSADPGAPPNSPRMIA
jgi:diguanylate cyclase (GGDEF)-like protein